MAQIDISRIKKIDKNKYNVHDKVFATYTCFNIGGEKYVQLDTYGAADREFTEKISQSIQFDRESAKYLVDLLINEYNFKFSID